MKYGFFDVENREYVITRPDTPSPWINYLGLGGLSGMISNTAGGMVFDTDPRFRRITRYKYNNLPIDRPGRYIYIKDMETGEYWSPSWQPVMKDLDSYECRHGMGYAKIKGTYASIEASTLYFVPLSKDCEVWKLKLENKSDKLRKLKIFTYLEFSHPVAVWDVQCDWPRMRFQADYKDNFIVFDPISENEPIISYFGTDAAVEGYDCCLEKYVGLYRSESNPIAVEKGECSNSDLSSDHGVGGLCCPVVLAPGESQDIHFILGVTNDKEKARAYGKMLLNAEEIEKDFAVLHEYWSNCMSKFKITTPDRDVNLFLNTWNQYQCRITFEWSRFISIYERGIDRGLGYRDTMQDMLGVMHSVPEKVKARLKELLGIQLKSGDAKAVYYPSAKTAEDGGRSDDHLWGILSVCSYVKETGDFDFLHEKIPYYDGGEGTVLEHLGKGIEFTMNHLSSHGIPLMLKVDWNDSLRPMNFNGGSESVFVFFQLGHAVKELKELYEYLGDIVKVKWLEDIYGYCKSKVDNVWDGEWFLRAFDSRGDKFGTHEDEYNRIFLNPQSWAVFSGLPEKEMSLKAFDSVRKHLKTQYGLLIHYPGAPEYNLEKKGYFAFPAGSRENAGIFFHTNPWAIISETMLGRNEYAFEYYKTMLPSERNDIADVCRTEPYIYSQTMLGKQHARFGASYNSWLTGTAAWSFVAGSQYIAGIRPDYDGLIIDPCLPGKWEDVMVEREFRGIKFVIHIHNRSGIAGKVTKIKANGKSIEGNKIVLGEVTEGPVFVEVEI